MTDVIQKVLKDYQPKPLGEDRRYAVLLPLVWEKGGWHILYQVRSEQVSQPGEVAFPGGALEEGESSAQAAIREVAEELCLKETAVELLGEIDYLVFGQTTIHCFVGRLKITDWRELRPNEEVARLFTVPLNWLLLHNPTYYPLTSVVDEGSAFPFERIRGGIEYTFSHNTRKIPFYDQLDETIWGMTAQFTHRFTEILTGEGYDLEERTVKS